MKTYLATITRTTKDPHIGASEKYVILTSTNTQTLPDAVHDLLGDCSIADNIVAFDIRECGAGIYKI